MKYIPLLAVSLTLSLAAQAPVVKKGSAPPPLENEQASQQAAPIVKKGAPSAEPSSTPAPVVRKGSAVSDTAKAMHKKKKKAKKKHTTVKPSQP